MRLRVAATFLAETLEPTLRFWIDSLDLPFQLEILPAGQVFAPLLEAAPAGPRDTEVIALVVRLEDWEPADADRLRGNVEELLRALAVPGASRILVFAPPSRAAARDPGRAALYEDLERTAAARLGASGVVVVTSRRIGELYPVDRPDDSFGHRLAHAPYSAEGAAAIATVLVREARALHAPPAKVIAVDCDETLGRRRRRGGAAGRRDRRAPPGARRGARGRVRARAARLPLQPQRGARRLGRLRRAGRPAAAPRARGRGPHRLVGQVAGLRRLAAKLGLGLDSFVFLDDSPLEVAEVRTHAPEVLAVQLPSEPVALARCLSHVWALDGAPATAEAARRATAYASEAVRERLREQSLSLTRYFETLELAVDVAPAAAEDRARVAELTFRTNQFNCSGRRLTLAELGARLEAGALECRVTRVRDRFGDYGLVGVALVRVAGATLEVDTLLLSCRALSRGVEHRMLADLGRLAAERGLARLVVPFVATARNRPAQEFLESTLRDEGTGDDGSRVFALPAAEAAAVSFDPEAVPAALPSDAPDAAERNGALARPHPLLARIPHELADARSIVAAVEEARALRGGRGPGAAARAPETPVERVLAELWHDVLGVPVGADDSFFEAGGDRSTPSASRCDCDRLGIELPLGTLFEAPSVRRSPGGSSRTASSTKRRFSAPRRGGPALGRRGRGRARGGSTGWTRLQVLNLCISMHRFKT